MIDLTKAPEGTTGYYIGPTSISFYNGDKYWHDLYSKWIESVNGEEWHSINVIAIQPEWSIYNNILPLNELSDEQAAELFNYTRHNGRVECKSTDGWKDNLLWGWFPNVIYRAKQKTERELFIDEWSIKIATNEYNGGSTRLLVGQMFDDINMEREGANGHQ